MMMNNRSIDKNEELSLVFDDQREIQLLDDQIFSSGLSQRNNIDYSSMGFMDMLGMNDYQNPHFGYLADDYIIHESPLLPELSEVVNTPTTIAASTLDSPSISSSSHDDPTQRSKLVENKQDHQQQVEEQDHNKTKMKLKAKKKTGKREREPRYAFMTKSEVDHLDDGYRWRKYGQKAVKNSSFPRSYHRCTTATCNVKKRVERSNDDPSIVVTTYEGIHTHPCPLLASHHRAHTIGLLRPETTTFGASCFVPQSYSHHQHQHQHQQQQSFNYGNQTPILSVRTSNTMLSKGAYPSSLLKGGEYQHGLLQDIVPTKMQMMEPKHE